MIAIEVRNVSKNYPLSNSQLGRLRQLFAPGKPRPGETLWALRDVSFTVERGEAFGIIGANGSGKSTLLQVIAGILRPTSGTAEVSGRLSALLELGSGFSPEFPGRDNVYLNGSLLGLSHEEIEARLPDIERFAGIGDFINQPIRTYSTGMILRLAFAVAAHVDPDILVVDEALAVGDIAFRQRCMRKIHELRARGATILFVSHETSDVKALCERCLWLQAGQVQELGAADEVVASYLSATLQKEMTHAPNHAASHAREAPRSALEIFTGVENGGFDGKGFESSAGGHRFGDGRATITGVDLVDTSGQIVRTLDAMERLALRIGFRVHRPISSPIAGFLIRNEKGESIFGSNTARENYPLPPMRDGEGHTVEFHWTVPPLAPAPYYVSVAISDGNVEDFEVVDYLEDAIEVKGRGPAGKGRRGYFQLHCAAVGVYSEARSK